MRRYAGRRNGECLSSIKACCRCKISISGKKIAHRIAVKNHTELLPQRESTVAAEFGIAHSIVSRLWRQFQTTGTAIRGFSSGRRGTTPQMTGTLSYRPEETGGRQWGEITRHTTQSTGRPISRFTVARRLHGGGLFARNPVRCVPLTSAH
ncbi:transposable element Tcb1 transposase [Trichonephila clavipes]|nr:transposable element Tcb1 transposase [Trichonephila clavipes]